MIIATAIKNYLRWSYKDAECEHRQFLPYVTITTSKPAHRLDRTLLAHLVDKTSSQMETLAAEHRRDLALTADTPNELGPWRRPPPVIYGFLIVQRNVCCFTVDCTRVGMRPRYVMNCVLKKPEEAFWNAIWIAMVIVMARNTLIKHREEYPIRQDTAMAATT